MKKLIRKIVNEKFLNKFGYEIRKLNFDEVVEEMTSEENQIIADMPKIVETFEMRELKALSFYPLPIYWYLAPAMTRDKFKVTIGGHGVDELLGAYTAWKELKTTHEAQIKLRSRKAFINNIYNYLSVNRTRHDDKSTKRRGVKYYN